MDVKLNFENTYSFILKMFKLNIFYIWKTLFSLPIYGQKYVKYSEYGLTLDCSSNNNILTKDLSVKARRVLFFYSINSESQSQKLLFMNKDVHCLIKNRGGLDLFNLDKNEHKKRVVFRHRISCFDSLILKKSLLLLIGCGRHLFLLQDFRLVHTEFLPSKVKLLSFVPSVLNSIEKFKFLVSNNSAEILKFSFSSHGPYFSEDGRLDLYPDLRNEKLLANSGNFMICIRTCEIDMVSIILFLF